MFARSSCVSADAAHSDPSQVTTAQAVAPRSLVVLVTGCRGAVGRAVGHGVLSQAAAVGGARHGRLALAACLTGLALELLLALAPLGAGAQAERHQPQAQACRGQGAHAAEEQGEHRHRGADVEGLDGGGAVGAGHHVEDEQDGEHEDQQADDEHGSPL